GARAGARRRRRHAGGMHRPVRDVALRRMTVLLDALGTLVTFTSPASRLRALLAERHGVAVTEEEARAAMKAEIAFYRREHDRASDRAGLAALRRDCAIVLAQALPPAAQAIPVEAMTAALVDAIVFEP